jgi:ribosomal-protein-alanine N-acetyltransferase
MRPRIPTGFSGIQRCPLMVIRSPQPADEPAIARLFAALFAHGDCRSFHPHPLTVREAHHLPQGLCPKGWPTEDIYRFGFSRGEAVAYGMLRGWDEGFAEPSLGIAVHPDFRGQGLAGRMIRQLHHLARLRGAASVRLKVDRDNTTAVGLYQKFGYVLSEHDASQWLGRLVFTADATSHSASAPAQRAV